MKQFLVVLLLAITAVCFVLTEKKQNKVPERAEAISWEMKVVEKDQFSYLPAYTSVDSVVEKKVLPSCAKDPEISNRDIREMVDLIIELNGISNPNLIQPGQLLLCRFPDNKRFEFYEEVGNGQSLWSIVKNLLIVTYRPVYNSNSKPKK